MESLPNELRRSILQHLPLKNLKNIRLVSKLWAVLGQEYLFAPTYRTLPHRPDTPYLQNISHHIFYAPVIKAISFNHGEVNEYSGRHNSYFLQYLMEPGERLTQQHLTWEAYSHFKQLTDKYLPSSCDDETLTDIFAHLPNLTSLSISLMYCPFPETDPQIPNLLADIWRFPSTRLLPRVATVERMFSITKAISANAPTLLIKNLSHDRLPFEFFSQNPKKVAVIASAFRNLTSLTLHMDYSDLPNDTHSTAAFANLGTCLRAASLLQTLSLAFQGRRKINIAPLLENFADDEFTFQYLEILQFQGMITTSDSLSDWLIRHKKSLRTVMLGGEGVKAVRQPANGGISLESGSWKELIKRLSEELESDTQAEKENMGRCKIFLQGDLRGLESGESWILPNRVEATDSVSVRREGETGLIEMMVAEIDPNGMLAGV
ncbi:uncharacterized protein RSE6_09843 [Rhynchosporium secalis]|uniref:F-box domain-containing protein n=1 Tax=Rhynchosporium secalis TaxID=38038 RepID=A0A1E1MIV6_RHYSE|nr:uncharacterized protein RSE6_09843 [Rhynchosporium secalis]